MPNRLWALLQRPLCAGYNNSSLFYFIVWHGVMFIRQGLYQGGVYRFQLFIPDTYPDADCPVSDLFKYIYCATDFDNYFNLTYNEYISSNSLEKSCPQTHCSHCLRIRELYLIFFILFQSLIFDPPVFHPIINASSGELDVKRAFPKWK